MINLKQVVTQFAGKSVLTTQKYSPEILTVLGVGAVVTAAVFAAKATLKIEPIISDHKLETEIIREDPIVEQKGQRLVKQYVDTSFRLVKLYGPSVSLGAGGIVAIICANGILRKRNLALVAAYKTIETSYQKYRERVVEEFGEEKDADLAAGVRVIKTTDDKGKVKTETIFDPTAVSGYARWFDETSNSNWQAGNFYNLMFLKAQQQFANDRLHMYGWVTLNDVYEALGFERTQAGQVVGWRLSPEGDNFIDFGIYNEKDERKRAFVNGDEKNILLDFNVDGYIFDKI